ncbi:MAG: hypothetical protein D6786_07260 [Gammaproteobacteria bacterium]|nr:MAG: hypothetical protein D6786_07260 [Gammaproteobacteria bacterium]
MGLLEPIGNLRLNYSLGRRWSVEASSGRETGVDLFYVIER